MSAHCLRKTIATQLLPGREANAVTSVKRQSAGPHCLEIPRGAFDSKAKVHFGAFGLLARHSAALRRIAPRFRDHPLAAAAETVLPAEVEGATLGAEGGLGGEGAGRAGDQLQAPERGPGLTGGGGAPPGGLGPGAGPAGGIRERIARGLGRQANTSILPEDFDLIEASEAVALDPEIDAVSEVRRGLTGDAPVFLLPLNPKADFFNGMDLRPETARGLGRTRGRGIVVVNVNADAPLTFVVGRELVARIRKVWAHAKEGR
jgi:hypothetical protein